MGYLLGEAFEKAKNTENFVRCDSVHQKFMALHLKSLASSCDGRP